MDQHSKPGGDNFGSSGGCGSCGGGRSSTVPQSTTTLEQDAACGSITITPENGDDPTPPPGDGDESGLPRGLLLAGGAAGAIGLVALARGGDDGGNR